MMQQWKNSENSKKTNNGNNAQKHTADPANKPDQSSETPGTIQHDHPSLKDQFDDLYNRKRFVEVLNLASKVLVGEPENLLALEMKGTALNGLRQFSKALKFTERVLESNPDSARAWLNKATALLNMGQFDAAVNAYLAAIKRNDQFALAWMNLAFAYTALGRHEEALTAIDNALAVEQEDPWLWLNKGNILCALERYPSALENLDRAVALDPELVQAWNIRGYALQQLERHAEADQCRKKVKEIFQLLLKNGKAFADNEQWDKAIDAYNRALEIDPKRLDIWLQIGQAYTSLGNREAAMNSFDNVFEFDRYNADAWIASAESLAKFGEYDEALKNVERILRIRPNDPALRHKKGRILRESGDVKLALDYFDRAVELQPGNYEYCHDQCETLISLYLTTKNDMVEALEADPNDQRALQAKYFDLPNLRQRALETSEKLIEMRKTDAAGHFLKACSLALSQDDPTIEDKTAALPILIAAIRLKPDLFNRARVFEPFEPWLKDEAFADELEKAFSVVNAPAK